MTTERGGFPQVRDGILFEVVAAPMPIHVGSYERDVDLVVRIRATGRLVAVVRHQGSFEPDMVGPLALALVYLDKTLRAPGAPRSAGILACEAVDTAIVRTALAGWVPPIRVAETGPPRLPLVGDGPFTTG